VRRTAADVLTAFAVWSGAQVRRKRAIRVASIPKRSGSDASDSCPCLGHVNDDRRCDGGEGRIDILVEHRRIMEIDR